MKVFLEIEGPRPAAEPSPVSQICRLGEQSMTFVVGVHLGDAVGILADTRVTAHSDSRTEYFDNALKVYQRPPLLIGLAGDAIASDLLVTTFQLEHLVPLDTAEAYARSIDADWMLSKLQSTYANALRQRILDPKTSFSLIIAAEDSMALQVTSLEVRDFYGILDATISESAAVVGVNEREEGARLVFAIDFPSQRVDRALPGTVVMRGSGTISEAFLRTQKTILVGTQLSFGDRFASIARDMLRAAEGIKDPSYNSAVLGWARSYGYAKSVLQDLKCWPEHSAPPTSYFWEEFGEEDIIPEISPYAVGSDLQDFELGWIYDVSNRRKMRVDKVTRWIGARGGRSGTSKRYLV